MKKNIFILVFMLALGSLSFGQHYSKWELEWNIGFPGGDFNKWIDETSLRGIEFGGTYEFETNVTLGGTVGYSGFFKETERMTVEWKDNALTAKQFRDVYNYFILVEGGYSFLEDSPLRPFIKFGIGTYYTEQQLQIGLLYLEEDSWDFGIRPEIGLYYFNSRSQIGVTLNGKYNYIINYGNDLDNFYYWTLGVGVIFQF